MLIFADGETGAGKTHTCSGCSEDHGVVDRAVHTLFAIKQQRQKDFNITIKLSLMSFDRGKITDPLTSRALLRRESLKIKRIPHSNGTYVDGLTMTEVMDEKEAVDQIRFGFMQLSRAMTLMGCSSSQLHFVVSLYLSCQSRLSGHTVHGKLHVTELAGSERPRFKVTGDACLEAKWKLKSLASLGEVLWARTHGCKFVPYRNSKLTYALRDSLEGNSKTVLIAHVKPVCRQECVCSKN